ncbi:hypothetical protein GDO78_010434 [Eleutherodactylus coqui]|uniref:THAP-type domain-containing protein n=1 Tax=Eleutherodactylus coqui TaxID=57060 RepID=A0A8J6K621_ELECQ|nr:hypothetical protein GDO78_010434 [Eleutherodactylus coqui]
MAAYHCCVPFCNSDSRYNADKKISFHRIPAFHVEPQRHRDWLNRIRREPGPCFKVSSCTRVCSKHFLPFDFVRTLTGKRNLKPYSVPCIFQWSTEENAQEQLSVPKRNSGSSKNMLQPILPSQPQVQNNKPSQPVEMMASILDHCYDLPPMTDTEMLHAAREEIARLQQRNALLESNPFFLERFSTDSSLIHFYTGFKDYSTLKGVFLTLTETKDSSVKWKRCQQEGNMSANKESSPESETMSHIDQFFLFLCKVRQGFHNQDLAIRFNISQPRVSRIVVTWAHYLYLVLSEIPLWRSRETGWQEVPECFKDSYPRARVTLHCAEIKVQTNSTDGIPSQIYYNHTIYRGLLGIAPHGAVIFISPLYSGCTSKRDIIKSSGILDLLELGDWMVTEKDFLIQDLVESVGAFVVTPPIITAAALPKECREATVMLNQPSTEQNAMYIMASTNEEGQETLVVTATGVEDAVVELEQSAGDVDVVEEVVTEEKLVEEVVTTMENMEGVSGDYNRSRLEVIDLTKSEDICVRKDPHYGREEGMRCAPHIRKAIEESSGLNKDINSLARLRICINQDIERVRQYHLFDNVLPYALGGIANQLWAVCAMLTNINGSLS